jgi:hypothetical protein
MENKFLNAYMCRRLITSVIKHFSLLGSSFEIENMMKMMMNLEIFLMFLPCGCSTEDGEGEESEMIND